jgi:hypothetical protein
MENLCWMSSPRVIMEKNQGIGIGPNDYYKLESRRDVWNKTMRNKRVPCANVFGTQNYLYVCHNQKTSAQECRAHILCHTQIKS